VDTLLDGVVSLDWWKKVKLVRIRRFIFLIHIGVSYIIYVRLEFDGF